MNEAGLSNQIVGPSSAYFLAGDERANTGFGLMAIHSLFVREHNRVADQYVGRHSDADPEDAYQFARRWTAALIQSVTYGEFIPAILGNDAIGPYRGYDPDTDPTQSAEFVTFGLRFGHSMLSPVLRIIDNSGTPLEDVPHEKALLNIGVILRHGVGPVLKGFASQAMQEVDVLVIEAMRSIHFPGSPPIDLIALDLQRARDHGVPGYNRCRLCFGLDPKEKFADVTPNTQIQQKLECTYPSVGSIDPLIGGLAEAHVPGSAFGPLLRSIMIEQFVRMRAGDRFWYENDPAFNAADLAELRQTRLADIIRRNTAIENIQDEVFRINDHGAGRSLPT